MKPGQILVADQDGVQVIKMVGDVRLTLCVSFDQFINSMFKGGLLCSILFDLNEAESIDSTTLGLMAKIALLSKEKCGVMPVVFSTNPSINRLLETMGFEDIFEIIREEQPADHYKHFVSPCKHITDAGVDEESAKERVLEAHHILMQLNDSNRETFRDLINTLEGR